MSSSMEETKSQATDCPGCGAKPGQYHEVSCAILAERVGSFTPGADRSRDLNAEALLSGDLGDLEAEIKGIDWLMGNDTAIMGLLCVLIEEVRGLRRDINPKPESMGETLSRACKS